MTGIHEDSVRRWNLWFPSAGVFAKVLAGRATGTQITSPPLKSVYSFFKDSVQNLVTDVRTDELKGRESERVLSAIAKFVVHFLGEGEARCGLGGEGIGEDSGEEGTGGYELAGNLNAGKNSTQV